MTDTNQLPEPDLGYIKTDISNQPAFSARQMREAMRHALQARAQVQGEPFGYIHHFAAHDESGALIDTTWEADGCADPLPHPTFPSMWKWAHCTPFYTTPQPAQVRGEPVGFTYQAEIAYADSTGGNGSFWRVPPDLDDEAVPLYTHPAPSVPADVVRVPVQVLKDASEALGNFVSDHGWGDADMQAMDNLDAYIARHEANRAAMLAAK